jgi:hypothetical protein
LPQDHHIEEKASLQPVMQVQSVPANPQPRVDTVIPKPNIPTAAASLETAGPQASVAGVRELTLSQNNQIAPATSPVTPNQASVPPTSSVPVSRSRQLALPIRHHLVFHQRRSFLYRSKNQLPRRQRQSKTHHHLLWQLLLMLRRAPRCRQLCHRHQSMPLQ